MCETQSRFMQENPLFRSYFCYFVTLESIHFNFIKIITNSSSRQIQLQRSRSFKLAFAWSMENKYDFIAIQKTRSLSFWCEIIIININRNIRSLVNYNKLSMNQSAVVVLSGLGLMHSPLNSSDLMNFEVKIKTPV